MRQGWCRVPGPPTPTVRPCCCCSARAAARWPPPPMRSPDTSPSRARSTIPSSGTCAVASGSSSRACTTSCTSSSSIGLKDESSAMAERPAPLMLIVDPGAKPGVDPPFGTYAAVRIAGRRRLAIELSRRLIAAGSGVAALHPVLPPDGEPFHWGRWYAAAARAMLSRVRAEGRPLDAIGYAGAGALALADDPLIERSSRRSPARRPPTTVLDRCLPGAGQPTAGSRWRPRSPRSSNARPTTPRCTA